MSSGFPTPHSTPPPRTEPPTSRTPIPGSAQDPVERMLIWPEAPICSFPAALRRRVITSTPAPERGATSGGGCTPGASRAAGLGVVKSTRHLLLTHACEAPDTAASIDLHKERSTRRKPYDAVCNVLGMTQRISHRVKCDAAPGNAVHDRATHLVRRRALRHAGLST